MKPKYNSWNDKGRARGEWHNRFFKKLGLMQKINIKPLSVNQCRQWKRFKTKKYKEYESILLVMLPKLNVPDWDLKLTIERGFSSKLSDNTNPLKPFEDILQKKYGFDDRRVVETVMRKRLVKKWQEYIEFDISAQEKELEGTILIDKDLNVLKTY